MGLTKIVSIFEPWPGTRNGYAEGTVKFRMRLILIALPSKGDFFVIKGNFVT